MNFDMIIEFSNRMGFDGVTWTGELLGFTYDGMHVVEHDFTAEIITSNKSKSHRFLEMQSLLERMDVPPFTIWSSQKAYDDAHGIATN